MGRATHSSRYLTMRDGVKVAVDVWLPAGCSGPLPVVFTQTR